MKEKLDEIFNKTKATVVENDKINKLMHEVSAKLKTISRDQGKLKEFIDDLQLIVRMVKFYAIGKYRSFSNRTILFFVFGLIYFLTPIDIIPDFIPILGYSDDISIIIFILKCFAEDIEAFRRWENAVAK